MLSMSKLVPFRFVVLVNFLIEGCPLFFELLHRQLLFVGQQAYFGKLVGKCAPLGQMCSFLSRPPLSSSLAEGVQFIHRCEPLAEQGRAPAWCGLYLTSGYSCRMAATNGL